MAETAPVFNPDSFTPLDAAPVAPADSNPVFDPNNFKPLGLPNETVLVEETGEVIEMPHGSFEQYWKTANRGFDKGDAETEIGKLGFEQYMGNDTPAIRERIAQLHEEAGGKIETIDWIDEGIRATAQTIPFMKSVMGNAAKRGIQAAPYGAVTGLAFAGVGVVPGFFNALAAGALGGTMEQTFVVETGHLYREIKQFKDDRGKTVDPLAARITATLGGATSAGLEAIPMTLLFKLVPGSKQVFNKLGDKTLKHLRIPTGKGALRKFAINISTIMAAESLTEGAQEFVQAAAADLAKLTSDVDVPLTIGNNAMERVGNAMVEALKATPLIATGFSAPRLVMDVAEGRAAKSARPTTQIEKVESLPGEIVDGVTTKLRQAPVSPDLKTYKVDDLNTQEKEALADAGVEIADNGTIKAEDAEMIAAESMRRTDFYQKQLNQQTKAADTAETKALRKVARGRIRAIDNVVQNLDQNIDDTLTIIEERKAQGKPVKALDNKVNSLLKKRKILDEERASLLTQGTGLGTTRAAFKATDEIIELKGVELLKAERRLVEAETRATQKALRSALTVGLKDVKAAQNVVIKVINNSALPNEMKGRFLSAVKNIQTFEQLQRSIPRIQARIDALVEGKRRSVVVKKLTKILKNTAVKGIKGKFGPQVQAVLDAAREALLVSKEVAVLLLEKNGENGTSEIPSPMEALTNKILMLRADPRNVNLSNLETLLDTITQLIDLGKTIIGNSALAKQIESETLRTELLDLIGPERIETPQQRNRREKAMTVEVVTFLGMSGAWWNKLRRVMRSSDKGRVDKLTNELTLFKESRAFDRGKTAAVKRFTELMLKAMNTTSERALMKRLQADETVELNLGAYRHSDGETRNIEVRTRAQLRKRIMELKDPALKESMMSPKGNAYTEEIITALKNEMTELDYRMVTAQLEFYEEYYQRINEVYERVYGYTLPKIEFYSPIKRLFPAESGTVDEFMKGILYRGGVAPGSLKSRKPTVLPIIEAGDFAVLQSHISEMEYFIAYSEKTQQLNQVVGHKDVRRRIERVFGKDMWKTIAEDLNAFSKRGVQNSLVGEKLLVTLMRNFSFAQLGAKPQIGLKQLSSFAAFADDVKTKDFIGGIIKFAANPKAALTELNQSEFFRERGGNIDQDYQAILSDKSFFNFIGKNPTISKILMLPIKFGDKAAIAIGGYGHYHGMLKKNGGNKKAAINSMELLANRTQQSTDIDQLSGLQRQSSLIRVMTQFMSSANALARAEYNAIIDKSAGRISNKEFSKRIFMLHVFIPGLIQFIANGFSWDSEDQLRASLLGALNGVFIIGDAFDALARVLVSGDTGPHGIENRNPLTFFPDMMNAIVDFSENGISAEDFLDGTKAIDGFADGAGALTGIPVKTLIGEIRGIIHIVDGVAYSDGEDIKRGFLETLGYSSFTIDEKVLD